MQGGTGTQDPPEPTGPNHRHRGRAGLGREGGTVEGVNRSGPGTPQPAGGAVRAAPAATLILADISGYTRFLGDVGVAHGEDMASGDVPPAYPLMTTLLDAIVGSLAPPFRLAKLEGDAVFGYADEGTLAMRGDSAVACLRACYERFQGHLRETQEAMTCSCWACSKVGDLDLKFVLHHGRYVRQAIAGSEELLGPDVTLAHVLLKNAVTKRLGMRAYALLTERAAAYLEVPDSAGQHLDLEYEEVPSQRVLVLPVAA
jgi:hypothetical protein